MTHPDGFEPHVPILKEGEWSLWKSGVHGRVFFAHACPSKYNYSCWVWERHNPVYCSTCGRASGLIPKHLFRVGKMIEGLGDHSDHWE